MSYQIHNRVSAQLGYQWIHVCGPFINSSNLVVCGYVCAMLALSPGKGFGEVTQAKILGRQESGGNCRVALL